MTQNESIKRQINIRCLETGKTYIYYESNAKTALRKLIDQLNNWKMDEDAKILTSKNKDYLYIIHCGKTYSVYVGGENEKKN